MDPELKARASEVLAKLDLDGTRKQIREVGTKINNTEARFLVDRKYKNGY